MRIHTDLRTMQETARRQRLVKKIRQYRTTGEHHSGKKPQNPLKKDSNFYFHHKYQKEFMSLNTLTVFNTLNTVL